VNDPLKLENQLCFPLYACAKGVVAKYKPLLDEIDLTYTQYITMMVLWEKKSVNVKTLGESLFLDSGTLTPLLKKLAEKKLITRERSSEDERNLVVDITAKGEALRKKAEKIPARIAKCVDISREDAIALHGILHRMMAKL
jgi:DNA-binding MarR family transcriptional regulator